MDKQPDRISASREIIKLKGQIKYWFLFSILSTKKKGSFQLSRARPQKNKIKKNSDVPI